MFSRILIKLIDQAILPAILLIAVRIVSVIAIANYFGVKIELTGEGFLLSNLLNGTSSEVESFIKINSYSTLAIVITMSIVLMYTMTKSLVFHDSHIKPGLAAKLFSLKLSSFIQSSFELYSQAIVWLSYLYMLTIVSGALAIYGLLYLWVFYVALALAVISTVIFIVDIEYEINLDKNNEQFDEPDEYIVRIKP